MKIGRWRLPLGLTILILVIMTMGACAANQAIIRQGQESLSEAQLITDIKAMSSDDFEGRKPGTQGGQKMIGYLQMRSKEIGLKPGNGDSYLQEVPLRRSWSLAESHLTFTGGDESFTFRVNEDFMLFGRQQPPELSFEAEGLILAGYGVVDSAAGWDQLGDLDYENKMVIMFPNDPGFLTKDPDLFGGEEESVHAQYRTKFRNAIERGAVAAFIAYDGQLLTRDRDWKSLVTNFGRKRTIAAVDPELPAPFEFRGFLNPESVAKLLAANGLDYEKLLWDATGIDFKPVELDYRVTMLQLQEYEPFVSHNVLALLHGSKRPDEVILYTAHWDHMGRNEALEGDQIFNGAADNASGSAALLALAQVFSHLEMPPDRSIGFLWVTAEESGLLGSKYYAANPMLPLSKTVAVINIDMLIPFGATKDVIVYGYGKSDLDRYAEKAAGKIGMVVQPDLWPKERLYFRSDNISFARVGVPALSMDPGVDHLNDGQDSTLVRMAAWRASTYHKVTDEYDDSWDLEGIMDYLKITYDVGYRLSHQNRWPNWYRNDEFRTVRDSSMQSGANN